MAEEIKDGLLSGYLRFARFKKVVPHISGNKILDIGCDEGYIIPYLPKGVEYLGIERDTNLLNKAKRKYPKYNFLQINVTTDTIKQIEPKSFDTILMIAVIEHMVQPIDLLEKLRSILNEKGRIIITSPAKKSHDLLVLLSRIGLARNDEHEHESYIDNTMVTRLFVPGKFKLMLHKTFQFGMNQLWVLEKD